MTRTRAERAAAAGEGGPVVARGPLSSAALLPLTAPPSPRHGARVSRGEGRADTGAFTPILRWGENRELLVYFITSGTDQFPQAIAASKTAEACSQAPVC